MRTIGYVEDEGAVVKWPLLTEVIAGYVGMVSVSGVIPSVAAMKPTLDTAHANGQKCSFQLYAAYGNPGLNKILTDPTIASQFIASVVAIFKDFPFDGVAFDWECSNNTGLTKTQYTAFFKKLRAALLPLGKTISATENYGTVTLLPEAVAYLDFIGLMTYDVAPDSTWFCSVAQYQAELDRWTAAGFPKDRLVPGISFAGRGPDGYWQQYRNIIDRYDPPASADVANGNYFNGLDTVGAKAMIAQNYGGVFVYPAEYDHPTKSLLERINGGIPPAPPPPPVVCPHPVIKCPSCGVEWMRQAV
jgi:chitinase